MRPIEKGIQKETFKPYQKAKKLLLDTIGEYCSYCEIKSPSLQIDHVTPISKNGAKHKWKNFLLSCEHCNGKSNKSNKNDDREGYFWCDTDNTFLAFNYNVNNTVTPNPNLSQKNQTIAQNTIDLLGLNRLPNNKNKANQPTFQDLRWKRRQETWGKAYRYLRTWKLSPSADTLELIIIAATSTGHFSIWMSVFNDYPSIKIALISTFNGTSKTCFDKKGNPVHRLNGLI